MVLTPEFVDRPTVPLMLWSGPTVDVPPQVVPALCIHTIIMVTSVILSINALRPAPIACADVRVDSKALALIWYRALTWYSSPARPLAAPDDPRLVTGQ